MHTESMCFRIYDLVFLVEITFDLVVSHGHEAVEDSTINQDQELNLQIEITHRDSKIFMVFLEILATQTRSEECTYIRSASCISMSVLAVPLRVFFDILSFLTIARLSLKTLRRPSCF